jgi:serine/threonine-protein kinase
VLIGAGPLVAAAAVLYFMANPPGGRAATAAAPSSSTSSPTQPAAAAKSWSDSVAVVFNRDGATVRLRADSLSNCISVSHDVDVEGQTIPFERISSLEVLRADDHTSPNPKAQVRIQLLGGREISGAVGAGCDLFEHNDMGRYTTYWDRIHRIQFER